MSKKRASRLPDPDDVLAGRVRVRADELFALVHDVNPTGEESPRERERYALKSRLQGLLLTRFGDEVEIVPDPSNPDLFSLRHRSGLRDACHALVSQLPVEARALVRRRLDAGEGGADGAGPEATGPSAGRSAPPAGGRTAAGERDPDEPAAIEARGLAALEEYDYEEAQRLLTAAVERGASPAAARALLELLVDVLADDAAALGLEGSLAPASHADPAVRGFLALAAARSGDVDRAVRLVRGLDGPLPARVHAALARVALDAGDLGRAAAHLSAAREADPTLPEAADLAARLERARRDERKPAEEALLALHASGDLEAAESAARAFLARWPDGATACRVLREIEEGRRRERASALAHDGSAALERGDSAEAARLLALALAADPDLPGGPALLDRARRAAAEETGERAVRRVVEALASGPALEALSEYAEQPAPLRARVRSGSASPELALVEEVLAASPAEKPRAAAEAALALAAAERALRRGDAAAALPFLEGQSRAFGRLPRAHALESEARTALAAARAAAARASLDPVREALDRDDLDVASALLGEVRRSDLDAEGRAHLSTLADRLREARQTRQDALDSATRESARRALRLAVSDEPGPADELADLARDFDLTRTRPWLSADGRRLVLAEAAAGWLFVRVLDVERQEVVRRVSLRPPHPLGTFETGLVEGDRLRVVGEELGLVDLDLETNEVVRAVSLAGARPPSSVVEETLPLPSSDLLWLEVTSGPNREPCSYLVDTGSGRARSKLPFDPSPSVVFREAASFLVTADERRARLLTLDGLPAAGDPPALPFHLEAASPDPAGPGILLAGRAERVTGTDEDAPAPLRVLELRPGPTSGFGRHVDLPGSEGELDVGLATSRSEALAFALCPARTESRVYAIGPGLDLSAPARTPEETVLFVDAGSRHVVAGCWWGERFAAVPLEKETRWPEWKGSLRARDPLPRGTLLGESYLCETRSRIANAHSLALYTEIHDLAGERLEERVAEMMARASTGDQHEALLGALERMGPRYALRERVEADLVARFPLHPLAVLTALRRHASETRWERLRDDARALRRGRHAHVPPHVLHLEALALARLGELEDALALVEEIRRRRDEGACRVDALRTVLKECLAKKRSPSPLGRLVDAVRKAIAAHAAGEWQVVAVLLDRALVRASGIYQAQALLAAARLRTAADTPRALFRKRLALARLLEIHGERPLQRRDLPRLPGALDDAAVEAIAARAREVLERMDEAGEAPSPA
ncbi:MAG: hypothetical protein EDX89_12170 [Acidobacteria bacterium]|nr:MAG: hypothetical protein EDX89_12170 [Acidobacteriota bacterium]